MTKTAQKLKETLLGLPVRDRKELAQLLFASLKLKKCNDADGADEWLAELKRRSEEMKKDPSVRIPAEKVFAELRKKYS